MGGSGFRPATSDQRLPPPAQKATVPKTPSSRCPYTIPQQHSTEFTLKSTSPKLQNPTTLAYAPRPAHLPRQHNDAHITSPTRDHRGAQHQHKMSNRFGRDAARDDLFSSYNRSSSPSKDKKKARASPYNSSNGGGYGLPGASSPGFGAYPGSSSGNGGANGGLYGGYGGYGQGGSGASDGGYRSATPNGRGQYGSATLDELESQNEEQTGVLIGKVKMLKDVRFPPPFFPSPTRYPSQERGFSRAPFCALLGPHGIFMFCPELT
jgi:hypothetical protein